MKSASRKTILAAGALALLSALLAAQQAAAPKEPKYTEVKYSADMSSYKWEGEDRILVLKGNVKFVHDDTTLTADKVDYRESTRTAVATGNMTIKDDQNTITGDDCTVNFKEKKGSITGHVKMVVKPKPKPAVTDSSKPKDLKSEFKDEAVIACDKVDYFYKEKRAVISTPLTITQKSRVVTADSATYLGKDEIVQLVGNVKGKDEKEKHSFEAPKVTMSLNDEDQWIEAEKATGSFYVKEETEQPAEKPAEQPMPKQPAPAEKPAEAPKPGP
jgi:lipopolysaccharide assembly outer membrane protein LptD (OstA)